MVTLGQHGYSMENIRKTWIFPVPSIFLMGIMAMESDEFIVI
jgi:hypothetical protein